MKTLLRLKTLAVAAGMFGLSVVGANAMTYGVDTLLGSADLTNSGNGSEIAKLAELAGLSVSDLSIDYKSLPASLSKDDAGSYVMDVAPNEPGFFILKFGVGQTGFDTHYFFRNIAELTKLVWTDAQTNNLLSRCDNLSLVVKEGETEGSICRLSHVTYTDTAPVPLPAAGWVLIAGIGSLAALRRRRRA